MMVSGSGAVVSVATLTLVSWTGLVLGRDTVLDLSPVVPQKQGSPEALVPPYSLARPWSWALATTQSEQCAVLYSLFEPRNSSSVQRVCPVHAGGVFAG